MRRGTLSLAMSLAGHRRFQPSAKGSFSVQLRDIGRICGLLLLASVAVSAPGVARPALARWPGVAQKAPPVLCGRVEVTVGVPFATGPSDAEACFSRAFLVCDAAILTIQSNPEGRGGLHTLTTAISGGGCLIVDETVPTLDSSPIGATESAVTCAGLSVTDSGLSELICSGGPPLAPIPSVQP